MTRAARTGYEIREGSRILAERRRRADAERAKAKRLVEVARRLNEKRAA